GTVTPGRPGRLPIQGQLTTTGIGAEMKDAAPRPDLPGGTLFPGSGASAHVMHLLPLWVLSSALASTAPIQTTLPGGTWELRASGGVVSDGYANLSLGWDVSATVGITDRIQA